MHEVEQILRKKYVSKIQDSEIKFLEAVKGL